MALTFTVFCELTLFIQIDTTADETFAPWGIAAFGFGQTIGCVVFGWASNKLKNNRLPMVIGMSFMIVGNLGYCTAELFPFGQKWVVFCFRVVTGFGAGKVFYSGPNFQKFCILIFAGIAGVIRAYCATVCKKEEYTKAVTGATAALALAIMAGPGYTFCNIMYLRNSNFCRKFRSTSNIYTNWLSWYKNWIAFRSHVQCSWLGFNYSCDSLHYLIVYSTLTRIPWNTNI